jgi:hypothetical protein
VKNKENFKRLANNDREEEKKKKIQESGPKFPNNTESRQKNKIPT